MTAADFGAGSTGETPHAEPRDVRSALAVAPRAEGTLTPWRALPSEIDLAIQVPREHVTESELEAAVASIHRALDQVGVTSHVGTTLNWLSNSRTRKVHLSIVTRSGRTTIEAHEKLAPIAGTVYGFGVGGVGVFGLGWTGFIIGINTFHSAPLALGIWGAAVVASWGAARALYAQLVSRRRRQLSALIDDIGQRLLNRTLDDGGVAPAPKSLPVAPTPSSEADAQH